MKRGSLCQDPALRGIHFSCEAKSHYLYFLKMPNYRDYLTGYLLTWQVKCSAQTIRAPLGGGCGTVAQVFMTMTPGLLFQFRFCF